MIDAWVPHDIRDAVVDYLNYWSGRAEIPVYVFVIWLGIRSSKYYNWKKRYGKINEHNAQIPRYFWLEDWEKKAMNVEQNQLTQNNGFSNSV